MCYLFRWSGSERALEEGRHLHDTQVPGIYSLKFDSMGFVWNILTYIHISTMVTSTKVQHYVHMMSQQIHKTDHSVGMFA